MYATVMLTLLFSAIVTRICDTRGFNEEFSKIHISTGKNIMFSSPKSTHVLDSFVLRPGELPRIKV